jgi:tetratricopeptide (TPR) repeat protein
MRFSSVLLYALTAFAGPSVQAQVATRAPISPACIKPDEDPLTHDPISTGLTMNKMAALLSASGRLAEAETMAQRSVHILEEICPPDDPALMRPLQVLAAIQFQRGKIARAREAFRRMQSIRTTQPEDRALVDAMAAALLEAQGRWPEAEVQYAAAIQALNEAGRGGAVDAGTLLVAMGGLYIKEQRMSVARQALNEALAIFERAPDAVPSDCIDLLHTRGVLCARQGEWGAAVQDLAAALSIADRESRMDPTALRSLLIDYRAVLRKNHRRREARSIETRIAALGRAPEDRELVDVTDLLARPKGHK